MAATLKRPGRVNSPAPFLWIALTMVFSRWVSTVCTVFLSSSVWATRCASRLDLLKVSFSGLATGAAVAAFLAGAAVFAGAAFLAVVLVAVFATGFALVAM